jgi:hypothetical protein
MTLRAPALSGAEAELHRLPGAGSPEADLPAR